MTRSDDKSRVSRPEVPYLLNHKLFQSGVQNLLQLILVLRCSLCEEESPDAHGGIHDVAGLQYSVEVPLDTLEVELAVGVVRLVQDDETEHVVLDAVPHRGVVGMGAFEVGLYGQQMAGVARNVVEAHACETQRVDLNRDGTTCVLVHAELHMHREVAQLQRTVQVDAELVESGVVALEDLLAHTIEAVADIRFALEDVVKDVDDVGLALCIVIGIHGIFFAFNALLQNELLATHHSIREDGALLGEVAVNVIQSGLPFFFVAHDVDSYAQETYGWFQHQRQRQLVRVELT